MRDARRRNRNIGTAKAGHGANNRMTIPDRGSDLTAYWERLSKFVAVEKSVNGHPITFLVEPPRAGYFHHCTVQDVLRVLELLPGKHVEFIDLMVFRQPTRKQVILMPVWGRLGYWSRIGRHKGTGVYLEAQPEGFVLKWGKSLWPEGQAELDRLRSAGFRVEHHAKGYRIHSTPQAVRASQLYRTLPHEIGHCVDRDEFRKKFEEEGDDSLRYMDLYSAKPTREKEVYAHRYADEFRRAQEARGRIPFEPICDAATIRADRLSPEWFVVQDHARRDTE